MKRPKRQTKRERKVDAPPSQGEQYQQAVRAVVMCSHVLSAHDIPGLIRAAEDVRCVVPIGGPDMPADMKRKLEALTQDIATLKAGLPLWEHSKRVREGLKLS